MKYQNLKKKIFLNSLSEEDIDGRLIFCLVVPFLEVILRTAIECLNCSCHICEKGDADKTKDRKEDKKKGATDRKGVASGGEVPQIWLGSGAKVFPQQVCYLFVTIEVFFLRFLHEVPNQICYCVEILALLKVLENTQDQESGTTVEAGQSQDLAEKENLEAAKEERCSKLQKKKVLKTAGRKSLFINS